MTGAGGFGCGAAAGIAVSRQIGIIAHHRVSGIRHVIRIDQHARDSLARLDPRRSRLAPEPGRYYRGRIASGSGRLGAAAGRVAVAVAAGVIVTSSRRVHISGSARAVIQRIGIISEEDYRRRD